MFFTRGMIASYLVIAAGGATFVGLLWWWDDWIAGLLGGMAVLCIAMPIMAYHEWRFEREVLEDTRQAKQAYRLAGDARFRQKMDALDNHRQETRTRDIAWLEDQRRADAAAMLEYAEALALGNETLADEAAQGRPFLMARLFRNQKGQFAKPPMIESSAMPLNIPPPDIEAL
jgi:hypothetical protein